MKYDNRRKKNFTDIPVAVMSPERQLKGGKRRKKITQILKRCDGKEKNRLNIKKKKKVNIHSSVYELLII